MSKMVENSFKWFNKIPNTYTVFQVKNIFNIGRGRVIAQTELKDDGIYPVYSSQTLNEGCLGFIDTYDFDREQLTWTTDGANAGTIFIRSGKHNCTNVCGTLWLKEENKEKFNLKYLKYILEYTAIYYKRADTNGFKIMNNEMASIHLICPILSKQNSIVKFLDKKSRLLEDEIKANKKLIKLMEEYRKSIFAEEIKKYSNVKIKLKFLIKTSLQYGANSSGIEYSEELPRYIRITDIDNTYGLKTDKKLSLTKEDAKDFILFEGDVLFARSGATVGKTFIYKEEYGLCAFAGYLIRASFNDLDLAQYVYNYTNSIYYEDWKNSIFIQSTIQNIGADKYNIMPVIMPADKIHLKTINKSIRDKEDIINEAIKYREKLIDRLEEYKKSLIYEVVTGKIEV